MGGMVSAIEKGYPQREIAASAYRFQRQLEAGERVMVGVNKYDVDDGGESPAAQDRRRGASEAGREPASGEGEAGRRAWCRRASTPSAPRAATGGANLMPPIIVAAKAYCTQQEICDVLRAVFGTYSRPGGVLRRRARQ